MNRAFRFAIAALARRAGRAVAAGACLLAGAASAEAQQGFAPTVQLPTFGFTTVATSVSVPDRGGAFIGGIGGRSAGAGQFGSPFMPGNRSSGVRTGASGMSVHVQIHDMTEYDAQLLAEARRKYGTPSPAGDNPATMVAGSTAEVGAAALADLEAVKNAAADEARAAALKLIEQGRAAEAAGKVGAAKAYYRMAVRKAPPDLAAVASNALKQLVVQRVARSDQ